MKAIIIAIILTHTSGCIPLVAGVVLERHSERRHDENMTEIQYRHQEHMYELQLREWQLHHATSSPGTIVRDNPF